GGTSDAVQLLSDGELDMPGPSPVDPVTDPVPPPAPSGGESAPTHQPAPPAKTEGGEGGGDGEWGNPSVEELGRVEAPSDEAAPDAGEPESDNWTPLGH